MAETKYKTLGEIGTFVRGGGLQKKDFRDNGVPCIHYGQVYTHYGSFADKTISFVSPELASTLKKAQKGDIIIVCTSENVEDVCKCVVWLGEEDVCVGGETYIFKHNQDPRYLAYNFLTEAFIDFKKKNYTGTKVFRIHENELKTFSVPLPPLAEQHAIASALTSIDNLIASLDKLIAKTQSVKQGAMQQLLTGKTRLKGFNEPWKEKKLGECSKFISGSGFPLVYQGEKQGKYPFYKVSDLSNIGNEKVMHFANNYINDDVAKLLQCSIIPPNSIIFAKIGAAIFLERKRITSCNCCIDNNMMALQTSDVEPLFLYYWTQNVPLSEIANTSAVPNISSQELYELPLRLPQKREEQRAIASVLTSIDDQISVLEAKRKKYEMVKVGMMQQLLTGKIRLK